MRFNFHRTFRAMFSKALTRPSMTKCADRCVRQLRSEDADLSDAAHRALL